MKKIISIATVIITPVLVKAQGSFPQQYNMEVFNIIASIFVLGMFMVFILTILKRLMDNRLKNKIVDKGIPENIISSILQPETKEGGNINVKWFAILASLGIALTIINYTQPLGIHSLAIMAFCMATGFLGYYFFIKQSNK